MNGPLGAFCSRTVGRRARNFSINQTNGPRRGVTMDYNNAILCCAVRRNWNRRRNTTTWWKAPRDIRRCSCSTATAKWRCCPKACARTRITHENNSSEERYISSDHSPRLPTINRAAQNAYNIGGVYPPTPPAALLYRPWLLSAEQQQSCFAADRILFRFVSYARRRRRRDPVLPIL